ncbi:MAG: hypothetical protein LBE99_04255 [Puniceicoccales bacterium]|jgi:hypothetical protein|nr:hypothetical protein [Puniceicoccales bacterium]
MKIVEKFLGFLTKLNSREKLLCLIFVWFAGFIWLTTCLHRAKKFKQDWQLVQSKTKHFNFWIKNEAIVKSNLTKILTWIDPEKTYSGTQLAGQVETVARDNQLTYSMTSPKTRQGDIFNAHTLQLRCENASLKNLVDFENAIYAMKPYIALEKVKIRANNFNPTLLEVNFDLIALQLKDLQQ